MFLKDKVDDFEQYSGRNSIRINCVSDFQGEDTDDIAESMAKAMDVELTDDMIDRSHRVGPKSTTDHRNLAIVVKFTPYKHNKTFMSVSDPVTHTQIHHIHKLTPLVTNTCFELLL